LGNELGVFEKNKEVTRGKKEKKNREQKIEVFRES
jgi:hypothetical protein